MAKFKCKASGTIVVVVNEYDIKCMRRHDEYEELKETKEASTPVVGESPVTSRVYKSGKQKQYPQKVIKD